MEEHAELVVERYLRFLKDPSSLVDSAEVAAAESRLTQAGTQVDRLLASRDIRLAKQPDVAGLRTQFRKVFPKWAQENGVTLDDLVAFSIPKEDLLGFGQPAKSKRAGQKAGQRVSGTLVDERIAGILADTLARPISVLATELTVSETAVRNSIRRLETNGRVIGTLVSNGSGRPSKAYKLS